jgi:hypothetical protein
LGYRFEESQLWGNSLDSSFGEKLRGTALGNSLGEQRWTTFRNSFEEHLLSRTAAFGHTFKRNFGEQFSVATLRSSFGELLLGALLVAALGAPL